MSSSIKLTGLLALASAVSATPHYGHQKYHHRAAYPVGGWGGASNSSTPAVPAGTAVYGEPTTTIGSTSTSTQTIYSTVTVKTSPAAQQANVADATSSSVCGGTVTVTAKEKVTVTVYPGGSVSTSAASSPTGNGYGASSAPASSAAASSKPVEAATSSKPVEYAASSSKAADYAKYPVESSTSAAPSKTTETPAYSASATKSSTSSAASASSTSSSGGMYSGAKRGLAYNDASLCSSFGSSFGFGYNWGQTESNDIGTMFIPMMHKPSDSTAEEWLANVDTAVKKGTTAVMGFNECDIASQCNMEPAAACTAWKEYMNPIKTSHPDVTIIGPSVSNGQAPLGLDWLSRFHTACPDASVDAGNIHFYDDYDSKTIDRFTAHIEEAAETYGKVWVTEFGLNTGTATEDEAASFLKDCMSYMDSSDKVQGYSWFMVGTGEYQLNSGDGLSAVGKVYAETS